MNEVFYTPRFVFLHKNTYFIITYAVYYLQIN